VFCGFGLILILPMISENARALTWGIPAFFIVVGAVSLEPFVARAVPRWLLSLGDASYSIYLSHGFVLPALGLLVSRHASPGLLTDRRAYDNFMPIVKLARWMDDFYLD
jgi:peptidoglycan/LPS O-acetylase OafA/YrhL